jgi:predicted Zn-dependent protease
VDRLIRAGLLGFLATISFAQTSPLLEILSKELDRNFRILKEKGDPAPYFLAYGVSERELYAVVGTLGALQASDQNYNRHLDVTVRVGSSKLDNYHRIQGERRRFAPAVQLPIESNLNAIRQPVWFETDRTYRQAVERLIRIRTSTQVKVASEDTSADFSQEEPSKYSEAPVRLSFPVDDWESRVRKWSAVFSGYPEILTSSVAVLARRETKYLTSTEGTRLQHGQGIARIVVSAQSRSGDGMDLVNSEAFEAHDPIRLPEDKVVLEVVDRVAKDLRALLRAPVAQPFVGPAILSGRATGVFFHEIFGHRVEGHRQKDEAEGQTFTKSVGTRVLPKFLSVLFDPTRRSVNGTALNGHYLYDDEGVKARHVGIVEDGILKTFLMSRSPVQGFDRSNGHGRRQPGFEVVSRQSNLIVESAKKVSEKRLRELLIKEIRRQKKPYGLYFHKVTGGFTQTRRRGLQAYTVIPILVYRVYADRRPDQLVRGADIVGTPLASFAKILATSDRAEVFNGYCGAESGTVPVSAVAPAVLVSEIEIQKKEKSLDRPPLLPRPIVGEGANR